MTDQTKRELLPCPFCGGADELVIQEGVDAYVVCDQCVIVGPTGTDAKAAALRWNRRARLAPAAPQDQGILDVAVSGLRAYCNKVIKEANFVGPSKWPGGERAFRRYNEILRECDKVFRAQDAAAPQPDHSALIEISKIAAAKLNGLPAFYTENGEELYYLCLNRNQLSALATLERKETGR